LIQNIFWPSIIYFMLHGGRSTGETARGTMWIEVTHFVERVVRLPIGPLSDDKDVRHELAIRVLAKLERDDFTNLREWLRRQFEGDNPSQWWSFVRMVAKTTAISYAWCCDRNLNRTRRGAFQWVREELMDRDKVYALLDGLNRSRALADDPPEPTIPRPPVLPLRRRRSRNH